MKTLKITLAIIIASFALSSTVINAQTRVVKKSPYPYFSASPVAGAIFPVGKFGESFNTGVGTGLELNYRVNKEVGFYGKFGYSFMPSKLGTTVPDGKYIEYTVGPRYYFTSKNLKSSLYLEAGVGGYTFTQDTYQLGIDPPVEARSDTKFGMNAGIGGVLNLGRTVDLKFATKYHNILTANGSTSFISPVLGIDIRFDQ